MQWTDMILAPALRLRRAGLAATLVATLTGLVACERPAAPPRQVSPNPAAAVAGVTLASAPSPVLQGVAASAPAVAAPAALPAAVLAFRELRDQCDHFRGEEGYDAQRAAFLAKELARTCTGTDAALAALRERYRQDPSALAALKDYEDTIE